MFKNYQDLVNKAIKDEEIANKEFENNKNKLTTDIKQILQNEIENIEKKTLLKDYSPIQHTNKMTEFNNIYSNLSNELNDKIDKIRNNLHQDLITKMKLPNFNKNYPKELYKVINLIQDRTDFICKVYFTLIPLPQWDCKEGDPIRIEWVHPFDNVTAKTERMAQGWSGLKIPMFYNSNTITNINNFFDFNHFGHDSNEQKWWMEWVNKNRPM